MSTKNTNSISFCNNEVKVAIQEYLDKRYKPEHKVVVESVSLTGDRMCPAVEATITTNPEEPHAQESVR